MEENKKSFNGILEKLALITDATEQLFPYGKSLIIFELNNQDFNDVRKNFRQIDKNYKKFTVDISGVEVLFINEGYLDEIMNKIKNVNEETKKGFWTNLLNKLTRKSSKPSV